MTDGDIPRIRELLDQGYSQSAVARMLGISRTSVLKHSTSPPTKRSAKRKWDEEVFLFNIDGLQYQAATLPMQCIPLDGEVWT